MVMFPKVYTANTESPTLSGQPWYDGHVLESLHNEHGEPRTVSSLFNCGMMVMFPKVYVTNTESPTGTVSSLFNCGMRVAFSKVYVSSTEELALLVASCIVQYFTPLLHLLICISKELAQPPNQTRLQEKTMSWHHIQQNPQPYFTTG